MCVWRNIETRPCNQCCSGKAVSITYPEYVICITIYPAWYARAPFCYPRPTLIVNMFPHYLKNGLIFGKKLLNTKCMFCSAIVVLLDWTLVQKRQKKIKLTWIAYHTHYSWESQTEFGNYIQQASLNFLSQDWYFMKFTILPTLLSTTKEGFSVAKTCFEHCLRQT